MKAAINPYTQEPIEKGDLVCANDVQELRDNVEKLLQFFHEHLGSTVNEYGSDNYPEIRQHGVVTESSNGFAPYTIFKNLDDYKQKHDLLNSSFNADPFPALSIVIWGGDYNDVLPDGWIFCDGKSVLYEDPYSDKKYYSPDLRYVEPVSVSSSRRFLSRMTGIDRTSATATDGTGVTKYYIIKKPSTYTPPEEPKALLTVVQPKGVRIATNCTTSNYTTLMSFADGHVETVEKPYGTDITISVFDGEKYIFDSGDKVYIKENSKSSKEALRTNTFKLQEDTEVTATSTYDRRTLTLVQPTQARIYTDEIPKSSVIGLPDGASRSAEAERGKTITVNNVSGTDYQLSALYIQRSDQSYRSKLSGNKFTLDNNTTVTADVSWIPVSYGSKLYTTPGTYIFTVPARVRKLRVTCISGGSGGVYIYDWNGSCNGRYEKYNSTPTLDPDPSSEQSYSTAGFHYTYSTAGGSSYIALNGNKVVEAAGGSSTELWFVARGNYEGGWNPAGPYVRSTPGPNGYGAKQALEGGDTGTTAGFAINTTTGEVTSGNYGKGGNAWGFTNDGAWECAESGTSGGYVIKEIAVTPGTTYSVVVGSGGAGACYTERESSGLGYNSGTGGAILIAYGGTIG